MTEPPEAGRRPRVVVCRGPRAAEDRLLAEVRASLPERGLPRGTVRIVVPSRSLRLHLVECLSRDRGRPLLGLACQTLHAVALEIGERAGRPSVESAAAFELAVRRRAREESLLADELAHLQDGWGAVAASVRDLLEAGFRPVHEAAADDTLGAEARERGATRRQVARARAVVRVAAAVARDLESQGVATRADLLAAATDAVSLDPETLPTSILLIHGFADATGAAADLLEALLRVFAGTAIVDRPYDPADPDREDAGSLFTRRLVERLALAAAVEVEPPPAPPTRRLFRYRALGERAEIREVGRRIRALRSDGATLERIGIVARDLAPYRSALRDQLDRVALPFSGVGATGPRGAVGRRLQALADLLRGRGRTPAERWLDAVDPAALGAPAADLRLALATLGVRRLADLAARRHELAELDDPWQAPVLPVAGAETPLRPRVPGEALLDAFDRGLTSARRLETWGDRRPDRLDRWLRQLDELCTGPLGWPPDDEATRAASRAVETTLGGLDPASVLDGGEWTALVARALEEAEREALGGRGGGVQVLDAIEARGRTFDHLFVVGVNRSRFPRPIREDPLLPDPLRATLARTGHGILPDLQEKTLGHAEERYLFAQLLAAAGAVTVSWLELDDADHPASPSPLVERLRRPGDDDEVPRVAPAVSEAAAAGDPITLDELGQRLGLAGARRALPPLIAAGSRGEATIRAFRVDPAVVAGHRLAVLEELDPVRGTPAGEAVHRRMGPFLGHVGDVSLAAGRSPSITHLEGFARCPWQHFLRRTLRLRALPDPLAGLPGLEPLWIGNLVHRALESLALEAPTRRSPSGGGRQRLAEALGREPRSIPWPRPEELRRLLSRLARRLLAEEGVAFPALEETLVAATLPYLEVARRLEAPDGGMSGVVATEVDGEIAVPSADGGARRLRFRADRLDRTGGAPRLTDYKTGRALSRARSADKRRAELLRRVRSGTSLQVAAYVSALDPAEGGTGRYLGLSPALDDRERELVGRAGDETLQTALVHAAGTILEAADGAAWFPRLVEPDADKEPAACAWCEVREACLWGDSGSRGRLLARGRAAVEESGGSPPGAFAGIWALPAGEDA